MADSATPWHLSGTYLESCNCEAICPCRRINGESLGRSTYGECLGALCWRILEGRVGEVELNDLGVVMATRFHDDEPGSPWTYHLYLDERGTPEQHQALTAIYTGELGGTPSKQFPWAFKAAHFLGARPATIEIDHTPGRGWFRAGRDEVTVRVREPVPDQDTVTCLIPGHHRTGREIIAEVLQVTADPLIFEFAGVCGYEATFDYSSEDV